MSEVQVQLSKGCMCDEVDVCNYHHQAVISRHGRRIGLDPDETKRVRDELTKALRQFRSWNKGRTK